MDLTIDFNTLTISEAEFMEDMTGEGLDSLGTKLQAAGAPKMKTLRALAAVAYARENSVPLKKAYDKVGEVEISTLLDGVSVEVGDHPTDESAQ